MIQNATEHRFEAGRDDVEGNAIVDAKIMKCLEIRVNVEGRLHNGKAIFEWDGEGSVKFVRDFAKGALARLHLLGEDGSAVRSTSEVVE